MKIDLRVSVDVDPDTWSREYGVEPDEVPEDVRSYVAASLHDMPVTPRTVTVRMEGTPG